MTAPAKCLMCLDSGLIKSGDYDSDWVPKMETCPRCKGVQSIDDRPSAQASTHICEDTNEEGHGVRQY